MKETHHTVPKRPEFKRPLWTYPPPHLHTHSPPPYVPIREMIAVNCGWCQCQRARTWKYKILNPSHFLVCLTWPEIWRCRAALAVQLVGQCSAPKSSAPRTTRKAARCCSARDQVPGRPSSSHNEDSTHVFNFQNIFHIWTLKIQHTTTIVRLYSKPRMRIEDERCNQKFGALFAASYTRGSAAGCADRHRRLQILATYVRWPEHQIWSHHSHKFRNRFGRRTRTLTIRLALRFCSPNVKTDNAARICTFGYVCSWLYLHLWRPKDDNEDNTITLSPVDSSKETTSFCTSSSM